MIFFLRKVLEDVEETDDDQESLNELLRRSFVSPDPSATGQEGIKSLGQPFRALSPPLRILVISPFVLSQSREMDETKVVVHCRASSAEKTVMRMSSSGLWMLDDNQDPLPRWAPTM